MTCFYPQSVHTMHHNCFHDIGPLAAQFILFTSLQKLDEAKRSRGGIRLRRGLLIAVTALKAKQLLWEQDNIMKSFDQDSSPLVSEMPADLSYSNDAQPNAWYPSTIDHLNSMQTDCHYYNDSMESVHYDSPYYPTDCPSAISEPPYFPPTPEEFMGNDNLYLSNCVEPPSKRIRLEYTLPTPSSTCFTQSYAGVG